VVPNGVDGNVFQPSTEPRKQAATEKQILAIGHLIEMKGHQHTIEAVSRLTAEGFDIQLAILGEPGRNGRYAGELSDLTDRLKMRSRVHFGGTMPQTEVAARMRESDLLVMASQREGFPNVVQEALACGTPVVATRVGAVPDMLAETGCGLIVEPGNLDSLTEAIRTALTTTWNHNRISAWGRRRTWEHVADDVHQQLQEAVRK
jgi:glycosyltransferase involved in cell wall biosynthesis